MSLISLQNVTFDFGREPVLQDIGLNILKGKIYGLAGRNGCGKSTLLSVINGLILPQSGTLQVGSNVKTIYLDQETEFTEANPETTLFDAVANKAHHRLQQIELELQQIADKMQKNVFSDELVKKQEKLQSEYEQKDGYNWQHKTESVLDGLGLDAEKRKAQVSVLSGGELRRAALGVALLSDCNLLLLDEPTNHLDLPACEWLEGWLSRFNGTSIIVSHDRHFLNRVTDTTLHLSNGKLTSWKGNYSQFIEQLEEYNRQQEIAWNKQQEEQKKTEEFIRKNIAGQKTKQAQSRRKQLDKQKKIDRPQYFEKPPKLVLKSKQQSGAVVLETKNISFSYDNRILFEDLSFMLQKKDRVGVIGPNGCGKSTLFNVLCGKLQSTGGVVNFGHNVDIGLYDQQLKGVTDSNDLIEEIMQFWPRATISEARSYAALFGFRSDIIDRKVGRLSGGERARLSLMKLIKGGHNTLFLDEPTNHLDATTRESLEEGLSDYDGTMIVVSHDRRFLNRTANKLLIFDGSTKLKFFDGNYNDYITFVQEDKKEPVVKQKKKKQVQAGLSKNEIRRRQKTITEIEETIASLEDKLETAVSLISEPDISNSERQKISDEAKLLQDQINSEMIKWEALNEEIDRTTSEN